MSNLRDLNDLVFFAAVVSNGGFSAAARALELPKSRISRRVAALEAQLGVRLLERSTRRFHVTEIGEEVFRHARAALCEAEAIQEVASRRKSEPQGLVRVSCPVGVDRVLSNALPDFLARYPRLRLQLIVTNRRIDLINEAVDVAVRVREKLDTDAELQVRILDRSFTTLVASPGFLATYGAPDEPGEIDRFATITLTDNPGPARWLLVDGSGREAVATVEPRLSASTFPPLRQAALDGLGIALLPHYISRQGLEDGRLVRVLPDWSGPDGVLHLVFTSRRGLLPGVRAAIDLISEVLGTPTPEWGRDL